MKSSKYLGILAVVGSMTLGGVVAGQAFAEPPAPGAKKPHVDDKKEHKKDEKKEEKSMTAKIGETAPAFTLNDVDGKAVNLADYKGKIVVLEWFNPECPFILKHHKVNTTFNTLHEQYSSKNVVFLAINSSAEGKQGYGAKLNKEKAAEFKMAYPILMDSDGKVGKMYGAKTTPHVFVIGTDGKLAYEGAIDNDKNITKPGNVSYVKEALDAIIAGKKVEKTQTEPYGCGVKYAG